MNRYFKWFQAFIYMALFCAPGIAMLVGLTSFNTAKFERQELRAPAPFPGPATISSMDASPLETLEKLPTLFEAWFNDHYGFRRAFITGNGKINKAFDIYPGGNIDSDVLKGKNGRLFLGDNRQKVMSQHTGNGFAISDDYLSAILKRFSTCTAWLAQKDVPLWVVMAPDKHTIYPEDLPDWLEPYKGETVADRFTAAAPAAGVKVVDVRSKLRQAKETYGRYLYYNSDTHWSEIGAYLTYLEIIAAMSSQYPGLKAVTMKEFKLAETTKGYDLARLGNYPEVDDFIITMEYNEPWHSLSGTGFDNEPIKVTTDMHVPTEMNVVVSNPAALNNRTLFIMRDSCSLMLSPLLNQTFTKVVYTSRSTFDEYKTLVEKFHPDIMIFQVVERSLPYL